MFAFIVLLGAALTRFLPHALHGVGLNFTAVGGGLLFFGARRPRWQTIIAVAVMGATDIFLTRVVYGLPFHLADYAMTWAWYAGVCLIGSGLLRRVSIARVGAAVLCSAASFFVLSNLVVWLSSGMYPQTGAGLISCYVAALPFFGNDLASTTLTATVLFGVPVLATEVVAGLRATAERDRPAV